MEFLVELRTDVPAGVTESEVDERYLLEAGRIRELSAEGRVCRLWRPPHRPGERVALGLFEMVDDAELRSVLATLPLSPWMTFVVTPLAPHPNDPAIAPA